MARSDFNINEALVQALSFEVETNPDARVVIYLKVNDHNIQAYEYPVGDVLVEHTHPNDDVKLFEYGEVDPVEGLVAGFYFHNGEHVQTHY